MWQEGGLAWELANLRLAEDDARTRERLDRQCRRPDRDEADGDPECEVCHASMVGTPYKIRKHVSVCDSCHAAGWSRRSRCACGRPLHHRDWPRKGRDKTACGTCRAESRQRPGVRLEVNGVGRVNA